VITVKHLAGLCGASAANSNCTEQNEPLLGRSDSLSGASHTASREQGGGSASDPNEPVEITTCSEGVASRVNISDISSVDRQDVAAAPTLAVTGPQPDPKDIPLAIPVSQSGSNNADVDDESPTSALFLQLEPADQHTRQKQPSAQQASPKAEQVPVDTLHAKGVGSEVASAQQPSKAAEQTHADSAQQMTDAQLPTKPPAAATEQGHVNSVPVQDAANEDSVDQQADVAEGPVTDEQGVMFVYRKDLLRPSVRLSVCLSVCLPWLNSLPGWRCEPAYQVMRTAALIWRQARQGYMWHYLLTLCHATSLEQQTQSETMPVMLTWSLACFRR